MHSGRIRDGALALAFLLAISSAAQASVLISSDPTSNMNCLGGFCQATAKKAVLNAADLANMLVGQDVTIRTGAGAVTITVMQPFAWMSSHKLSLEASESVSFQAPITVAGPGALVIDYAQGGTGDLIFFPGASVSFPDMSSTFSLQGQTYKLEASLDQLSADMAAANHKGNYALANDFDQTGQTYTAAPLNGSQTVALEGAGHTIANLTVHASQGTQCAGLFDFIFGSVNDLIVTGADISSGDNSSSGIIAGCGNATFAHDSTAGNVSVGKTAWAGGLAGNTGSAIRDSSSSANVTAVTTNHPSYIGGLVGLRSSGQDMTNSSASGSVTGGNNVVAGGLAGLNSAAIRFSHASGNVSAGHEFHKKGGVGGLVGVNYGQVTQSFATGQVSGGGNAYVGGLVGYGENVGDSYATGSAQCPGSCFAGGLIGGGQGIGLSYSTVAVRGGNDSVVGGLIGDETTKKSSLFDTYWDLDTSRVSDPSQGAGSVANDPGVTGLSNTELKSALPTGFDSTIWAQKRKVNKGYPYLIANPPQ